jgi:hypothetical protein
VRFCDVQFWGKNVCISTPRDQAEEEEHCQNTICAIERQWQRFCGQGIDTCVSSPPGRNQLLKPPI